MDIFIFQLAVIFLPGIIWERIVSKFALKKEPTQFETVLRTFTFGVAAYSITWIIYTLYGAEFLVPEIKGDAAFLERKFIGQYAATILVALVCAVLWLYAANYKLLTWALQTIKATKRYGDEDVWDFAFNSPDAWALYVYVRDYKNNKVYGGWVRNYSESGKVRELLLRDVAVYSLESEFIYEMPIMYIGRSADDVHIEFPVRG